MKTWSAGFLLLVALTALAACRSNPAEPEAPPGNRPAIPGAVDIDGLLLQPGDLPDGYKIAAEYPQVPDTRIFVTLHDIPKADRVATARLAKEGTKSNEWLVVQIFVDAPRASETYERLTGFDGLQNPKVVDLGFGTAVRATSGAGMQVVIYNHCDMVVYVETSSDSVAYAQAINERLAPLFCGN